MVKSRSRGQPLYMQVADKLVTAIDAKQFAKGSLLPTELRLCAIYNVSRHTIRAALRQLREQGLLSAKRGVGTRVEARSVPAELWKSTHSLIDIASNVPRSVFSKTSSADVIATAQLTKKIGSRVGRRWVHIKGVWLSVEKKSPTAWTETFVSSAYGRLGMSKGSKNTQDTGIDEIHLQIQASVVSRDQAELLCVQEGTPALFITRKYFAAGKRLMGVVFNLHPTNQFTYELRVKKVPSERAEGIPLSSRK